MIAEKQESGQYHIFAIEGIMTQHINIDGKEYKVIAGHPTEDYCTAVLLGNDDE